MAALTTLMALLSLLLWIMELGWLGSNIAPEDASSRGSAAVLSKPQPS